MRYAYLISATVPARASSRGKGLATDVRGIHASVGDDIRYNVVATRLTKSELVESEPSSWVPYFCHGSREGKQ